MSGTICDESDPGGKDMTIAKNTICIWYDKDAEAAARFYEIGRASCRERVYDDV